MRDSYKFYLMDLSTFIKERAFDAKEAYIKAPDDDKAAFHAGYLAAYTSILELMKNQAKSFDIDEKEIKLNDIDLLKIFGINS